MASATKQPPKQTKPMYTFEVRFSVLNPRGASADGPRRVIHVRDVSVLGNRPKAAESELAARWSGCGFRVLRMTKIEGPLRRYYR